MISHLNLPTPDIDYIISISDLLSIPKPVYEQNRQKHLAMTNQSLNIARCEYYFHSKLDLYTKEVYQPYFKESIFSVLIKLVNTDTSTPAFYMPHIDQKRLTSLNFYLEPGGSNVTTSIYHEHGPGDLQGSVTTYDKVTLKSRQPINDKKWYLLDVNRYHSVENIEHTRIVYALSFPNLSSTEFQERYKSLVATAGLEPATHGFSIRCST